LHRGENPIPETAFLRRATRWEAPERHPRHKNRHKKRFGLRSSTSKSPCGGEIGRQSGIGRGEELPCKGICSRIEKRRKGMLRKLWKGKRPHSAIRLCKAKATTVQTVRSRKNWGRQPSQRPCKRTGRRRERVPPAGRRTIKEGHGKPALKKEKRSRRKS